MFSYDKLAFGKQEVLVVGYLCRSFNQKLPLEKVNAIHKMKEECQSQNELRRFLGAYMHFTTFWIAYYAYMAKPLYRLPKKGRKFKCRSNEKSQRLTT